MTIKNLVIILVLLICTKGKSQEKYDISKSTLSDFIAIEKQFVGGKILDESVNSLTEELDIASFIRQDNSVPNLDLIVRYVFSKKDSLIKEIRYELDIANFDEKIENKQDKDFRTSLANHYILIEQQLSEELGKSHKTGEFTKKSIIDGEKDYYKKNTWTVGNTRIDLILEMSNSLHKKKNIYPIHKILIVYRTLVNDSKLNGTEYVGSKDRTKLIEKNKSLPKFKNKSRIPLISECKKNHTEACFQNAISNKILSRANQYKIVLPADTLKVRIRINKDGSTTLSENQTKNPELKKITEDVVNSLKDIEPAYIKSKETYETVSYSWYVIFRNNEITNRQ
ncbi:hypothetical protein [Maribacter sp. 1_MG-2023]|uniref:hypothetical protein n=1 Tax=Maribacter sp. 1_MG-2023 TaxID=3062677 RepID=UPI0026E17A1C|nr:hypothetical protein [Maribacter sp. 1_MG-2023]MDO6473098.1 hypothetical protein [Maribacter sp. 1_MG-2023]